MIIRRKDSIMITSLLCLWFLYVIILTSTNAEKSQPPLLIECYCSITLEDAEEIIVGYVDPNAPKALEPPSCLGDLFAETGIRWMLNGPYDPNINYERQEGRVYTGDRAAVRLSRLGYECIGYQLIDPLQESLWDI